MPFVTITTSQTLSAEQKQKLMQRTTDVIVETLSAGLPSVRIVLNELPKGNYYSGGQADVPTVLFEVDMIAGRSEEAKANLIRELSRVANETTGVSEDEIRARASDFPKENIGMARGVTAKAAGR